MRIFADYFNNNKIWRAPLYFIKDFLQSFSKVKFDSTNFKMDDLTPHSNLNLENHFRGLEQIYMGKKLWTSIFRVLKKEIALLFVIGLITISLTTLFPIFLKKLFTALNGDYTFSFVVKIAISISILMITKLIFEWFRKWSESRVMLQIQQLTSRLLFYRLQKIDGTLLQENGKEPMAYLTAYAPQLTQIIYVIDFCITSLLQVALLWLMFDWYGPLSILILAVIALFTVILQLIIIVIGKIYSQYMQTNHERIGILKTAVNELQSIKRQYLEPYLFIALAKVRERQVSIIKRRAKWQVINRTIEDSLAPILSLLLVCIALWGKFGLDSADLFPLLVLVGIILDSVGNNLANFRVLRNTVGPTREIDTLFQQYPLITKEPSHTGNLQTGETRLTLSASDISYVFPSGSRVAIVGRTGVGKSHLLLQLAGKPVSNEGAISVQTCGTSVFMGKHEPILDSSIAESVVLFDRPVNLKRYETALYNSGLAEDFAGESEKDSKVLYSKEKNLSEGQMQRLSLSQALYVESDILLLDDVFSSLNPELAHKVAARILKSDSVKSTCFYATSRLELITYADYVVVLNRSDAVILTPQQIHEGIEGTKCIELLGQDFFKQLKRICVGQVPRKSSEEGVLQTSVNISAARKFSFGKQPSQPLVETFESSEGENLKIRHLAKNMSAMFPGWAILALAILLICIIISNIGFSSLIGNDHMSPALNSKLILLLFAFTLIGIIGTIFRYILTFYFPISSIDRFHRMFIQKLLMNRKGKADLNQFNGKLTQDFTALEMEQPNTLVTLAMAILLSVLYLCIFTMAYPSYLILLVPFSVLIGRAYLPLKKIIVFSARLRASIRGPVINFISPALHAPGYLYSVPLREAIFQRFSFLSNIQAFGSYWAALANSRVTLIIDGIGVLFFLLTLWVVVIMGQISIFTQSLVVYLAYQFSIHLSGLITRMMQADTHLTLFERLASMLDSTVLPSLREARRTDRQAPEEAYAQLLESDLQEDPPIQIGLRAVNLSLEYLEGKPLFKEFSIHLNPGSSAALIGPSGVGKSTLAKVLSGLISPKEGTVSISGITPCNGDGNTRRQLVSLESSVPFLPITIRQFLDPFQKFNEEHIRRSCLHVDFDLNLIGRLKDRLIDLSAGERQLLNLVRAVLQKPEILILDEATSALDTDLERKVFTGLKRALPKTVLFVILHRTDNLDCFDEVIHLSDKSREGA